jgi:Tfp pilus assembly protein PilF
MNEAGLPRTQGLPDRRAGGSSGRADRPPASAHALAAPPSRHRGPGGAHAVAAPRSRPGLGGAFGLAVSWTLLALLPLPSAAAAPLADALLALRQQGLAELENERNADAEATFAALAAQLPGDPLPHANQAIAALRQARLDVARTALERALRLAPERPDLLAVDGELLTAAGDLEAGLARFRAAAAAAPDRADLQFALLRSAEVLGPSAGDAAVDQALERLARLRPDNLVVLLSAGRRAVARQDRRAATAATLRVRELLGEAPELVTRTLDRLTTALEAGDLEGARVPMQQLANLLAPSPLFQQGIRELSTGVLGIPVERFVDEPPAREFGPPLAVELAVVPLPGGVPSSGPAPSGPRTLLASDLDGDQRPDLARLVLGARSSDPVALEVRYAASGFRPQILGRAAGLSVLQAADLDQDGRLDLVAVGATAALRWRGSPAGLVSWPQAAAEPPLRGTALAVLDFDLEGDLDLGLAGAGAGTGAGAGVRGELLRSAPPEPLVAVGAQGLPNLDLGGVRRLLASDLDRDGDPDLVAAGDAGLAWLDNLRQGRFADRTRPAGLSALGPLTDVASADLDGDGRPDLAVAGPQGLRLLRNRTGPQGGTFEPWAISGVPAGPVAAVLAFDADNDGRLDLALAGPGGVTVLGQRGTLAAPRFERLPVTGPADARTALASADLDGDGDLDLLAAGPSGLALLENRGGNANHWLAVRLRGLAQGNGKNDRLGFGATVELRRGAAYQFREVDDEVTHLGLGSRPTADTLRIVWSNGVPQNRLAPRGDQRIVEEQVLKGSCPFLYAWTGERFEFVTDLLWNAPIGLAVAPGVWARPDPGEIVRVDGLAPSEGQYLLRLTEELWEAAFFDAVRLWVVDAPEELEVASNLRVVPGAAPQPEIVLASRALRPPAAAWDGTGEEVTARITRRDEVYAAGYPTGPFQGVAAAWTFTFELDEAPAAPIRLHLDGWVFPSDASLNLAVAQRSDLPYLPPRLEVETPAGWQLLVADFGLPPGKTKTMVVDTPALPAGARRLRIVSSLWLAWDRIAWTTQRADAEARVVARLLPSDAELRYRGFSRLFRHAPNAPHVYDYEVVDTTSPWLPFPGRYTRYGAVGELLADADDQSVILAPGDELALAFDATGLPAPAPGRRRTLFLESQGWDKDADRNTYAGERLEPLPFRAMSGYPWRDDERYPETPELERYRAEWLTREVGGDPR